MLKPYLQGGPGSVSHQDIAILQDLISTHQSTSSSGLVSVFTRFLQARMLPSESIIQYCSRVRGLVMELGRLGQPISEPLLRLLVIHSLTPRFTYFSGQVATGVIDIINGFDNWDALIHCLRDCATHANIRPSPATIASTLDLEDLVWIGQPNLDRHQTGRLMAAFTCPIHRHNDHTLNRCGALKRYVNVTSKSDPPPGGGSGNNRGGRSRGSDECNNPDSSEPNTAPPITKASTKGVPLALPPSWDLPLTPPLHLPPCRHSPPVLPNQAQLQVRVSQLTWPTTSFPR
jgi:hypothetical protein